MANEMIVIFHHDERGIVRTWSEIGRLVRCKDCKYYDSFNNGRNGMCCIHIDAFKVFYPNDYCSYGERKDG